MPTTKRRNNCFSNNLRPMFDLGNEVRFLGRLILKRLSVWFCSPLRSLGHNLLHHRLLLTKVHKHTQKHTKHKNTQTQQQKYTNTPNTKTHSHQTHKHRLNPLNEDWTLQHKRKDAQGGSHQKPVVVHLLSASQTAPEKIQTHKTHHAKWKYERTYHKHTDEKQVVNVSNACITGCPWEKSTIAE